MIGNTVRRGDVHHEEKGGEGSWGVKVTEDTMLGLSSLPGEGNRNSLEE